jgi:hypothetical protein
MLVGYVAESNDTTILDRGLPLAEACVPPRLHLAH